ncbi:MAG: hypothetical protein ACOH2H_16000 [Cypionkella sp.]
MVRQRRSIAEMRCTVCGERTEVNDRWWFGLGNKIEMGWWATTEAPVHRACADLATRVCPHLRKLGHDPMPFPGGAQVLSSIVGGFATDRDFSINLRGRKVIGHLKLGWRYDPLGMRLEGGAP